MGGTLRLRWARPGLSTSGLCWHHAAMDERRRIGLVTVDGRRLLWRKGGRIHDLPAELAPVWVASFKPALFQVLPDGHIVPRGSDPKAVDIQSVAIADSDLQGDSASDPPTPR